MLGRALYGEKTKELVKKIRPGDIAILSHEDIDRIAALSLIEANIKAIINTKKSLSGKYPNKGPALLLNSGIKIYDNCGHNILKYINNGDFIKIKDGKIFKNNKIIAKAEKLNLNKINNLYKKAAKNMDLLLNDFIINTLEYAEKEKSEILNITTPDLSEHIKDREVLIVIRGTDYKRDLKALMPYIKKESPLIIAVDGGADTCLQMGLNPDIIVGDMDSVSDSALLSVKTLVLHAYTDGNCPAVDRINCLGLSYHKFSAPGTSEDIAMLLAYENGAKIITAIGTHTNILDFLEKGRKGMGSTILVRLKIGSKLIDARGINKICGYE